MMTIPAVPVFVLLPCCIALLFGGKSGEMKRRIIRSAVVAVASGLVSLMAHAVLGSCATVYEYLLIDAVAASFITVLWAGIREKDISVTCILKLVCLLSMAVVIYSILTVGQTMIHGDTATASLLTRAQLKYGQFFPENWYYVNGDIWVISPQLFVAPFAMLLKDQSLVRALGSALMAVVTAWTMCRHSKKIYGDESWILAVPLLFVFLAGERDMTLYQAAYTLQMVFLIAGAVWMFQIFEGTCQKRYYMLLCIFIVMLVAGGVRYLAETVMPLWLTCMAVNYLDVRNREQPDWKQVWKEWTRLTLAVMIPAVIGLAVHLYLKRALHVINSAHNSLVLVSSLDHCVENVFQYIINLFECFGFRGGAKLVSVTGIWSMCAVVMCGIVVFAVPVLQARKLKQESAYVQFLFAFTVIHNLILFVLAVFLQGKDETRYLLTSVFLWILLSSRYIYVYWIRQKHFEKYIWTALFTVAVVLGCLSLGLNSTGWEKKLSAKEEMTVQLVERGLTKGYGSFWTACGYELYSDFQLRIGGLEMYEDDFIAHFWLIDGDVFTPEETNTFLLLTEEENSRYSGVLSEKFEEPIDYFEFNGNHIYVYDYDIAADMT